MEPLACNKITQKPPLHGDICQHFAGTRLRIKPPCEWMKSSSSWVQGESATLGSCCACAIEGNTFRAPRPRAQYKYHKFSMENIFRWRGIKEKSSIQQSSPFDSTEHRSPTMDTIALSSLSSPSRLSRCPLSWPEMGLLNELGTATGRSRT